KETSPARKAMPAVMCVVEVMRPKWLSCPLNKACTNATLVHLSDKYRPGRDSPRAAENSLVRHRLSGRIRLRLSLDGTSGGPASARLDQRANSGFSFLRADRRARRWSHVFRDQRHHQQARPF